MIPYPKITGHHKYPCPLMKARRTRARRKGYLRRGTTGAREKASRSHSSFIVPQVAGEEQSDRAGVGKEAVCIYGTTKGHHGFTQRSRNKENEI